MMMSDIIGDHNQRQIQVDAIALLPLIKIQYEYKWERTESRSFIYKIS